MDKVEAFGCEGGVLESSDRQLVSPPDNPMLASVPFLKMYTVVLLKKQVRRKYLKRLEVHRI